MVLPRFQLDGAVLAFYLDVADFIQLNPSQLVAHFRVELVITRSVCTDLFELLD